MLLVRCPAALDLDVVLIGPSGSWHSGQLLSQAVTMDQAEELPAHPDTPRSPSASPPAKRQQLSGVSDGVHATDSVDSIAAGGGGDLVDSLIRNFQDKSPSSAPPPAQPDHVATGAGDLAEGSAPHDGAPPRDEVLVVAETGAASQQQPGGKQWWQLRPKATTGARQTV